MEGDSFIQTILETDHKHRYEGVTDDLFTIEQYHEMREHYSTPWSAPVLKLTYTDGSTHELAETFDGFWDKYCRTYGELPSKSNDEFWNGVLIAGGSVCTCGISRNNYKNDIDVFLYGLTVEEANDKVSEIFRRLDESESPMFVARTVNSITVKQSSHSANYLAHLQHNQRDFAWI